MEELYRCIQMKIGYILLNTKDFLAESEMLRLPLKTT